MPDVSGAPVRPISLDFHLVEIIGEQAAPRLSKARARHAAASEELAECQSTHAEDSFARPKT
jgi:hypothetical protein